jgi:hypothetical protein
VKARPGYRRTKTSLRQAAAETLKEPELARGVKNAGVAGAEQALLFGTSTKGLQKAVAKPGRTPG